MFRRYLFNVLIALDQLGNALLGGDPDETISRRLARYLRRSAEPAWPARALAWLLERLDPGHLRDALRNDETGRRDTTVWRW